MKIEIGRIKPTKNTNELHALAFRGHIDKLLTRLDSNNVYQLDDSFNLPPVFWALLGRRFKIVDILLDVYEKDLSAQKSEQSFVHGHINARPMPNGDTLLHLAAFFGYQDVLERLLRLGADHTIQNDRKQTALCYALYSGHLEISKILACQPNVDFWHRDVDNNSLARAAACGGNFRTFEYTIDKMMNATGLVYIWDDLRLLLSETCTAGDSTLHEIARRGHFQLLKESRATLYIWEEDMARPNANGETVLHLFCQLDAATHTESLLRFVKKHPALLQVPRNDGKLPLDLLASCHRKYLKEFEQLRDNVSPLQ